MRVGIGYAALPFDPGRVLMLGGIKVIGAWGLRGRADGDVVLHAVGDALLGAAALGDLGDYVPADDPQWTDAPSAVLLAEVLTRLRARSLSCAHIDVSIVAERPDLESVRGAMRERLGALLGLEADHVSVKRGTGGPLGSEAEGIAAMAIVSVVPAPTSGGDA